MYVIDSLLIRYMYSYCLYGLSLENFISKMVNYKCVLNIIDCLPITKFGGFNKLNCKL